MNYVMSGNAGHFHTNPSKREEEFNQEIKLHKQSHSTPRFYPGNP